MKKQLTHKLITLLAALIPLGTPSLSRAQFTFESAEVNQRNFVIMAVPATGSNLYQLVMVEQVSNQRNCWNESGSNPARIDPLLLQFDFTGICARYVDSNGYSIRMGGQDLGINYSLNLIQRGNEVILVGADPLNPRIPQVEIGRTNGLISTPMKVNLNPGWRITRRTFQGQPLGHVYLTNNLTLSQVLGGAVDPGIGANPGGNTGTNPGGNTGPLPFPDIANDIYVNEIRQAVSLGLISGFEDNTFRPLNTLTREQLVSIIVDGLSKNFGVNINLPTQVVNRPYPDVEVNRWSAPKIQWARDNRIISGYDDGRFRPGQVVTRAELMAVQRRAAEYALTLRGQPAQLAPKQTPRVFSDTSTHWANSLVTQMSGFCGVASPLNETGTFFAPDSPTQRNYAAAATVRMINCVRS